MSLSMRMTFLCGAHLLRGDHRRLARLHRAAHAAPAGAAGAAAHHRAARLLTRSAHVTPAARAAHRAGARVVLHTARHVRLRRRRARGAPRARASARPGRPVQYSTPVFGAVLGRVGASGGLRRRRRRRGGRRTGGGGGGAATTTGGGGGGGATRLRQDGRRRCGGGRVVGGTLDRRREVAARTTRVRAEPRRWVSVRACSRDRAAVRASTRPRGCSCAPRGWATGRSRGRARTQRLGDADDRSCSGMTEHVVERTHRGRRRRQQRGARRRLGRGARRGGLRDRAALDDASVGPDALLDDVVRALLLEVALHALDRLGLDGAHVVAHVGYADGLEQPHDLLRVEVQLLGHLVDANLAAHRASGRLLHSAPSLVVTAARVSRSAQHLEARRRCRRGGRRRWRPPSPRAAAPSSVFVLHATARPSATALVTSVVCAIAPCVDRDDRERRAPLRSASSAASAPMASAPRAPRRQHQPRHAPVARRDQPPRRARPRRPSRPLERARQPPRAPCRGSRAAAWRCAPRPNAAAGEVEHDLVARPTTRRTMRRRRRRAGRSPRTSAPGRARRSVALASSPRLWSLSSLVRTWTSTSAVRLSHQVCGCAAASRALATASRRAASIVFASPDRKCSAPCLMARAFLMPRPVLMASLSSSSRRMSSTVL